MQETGNVLAIQVVNQSADASALILRPDVYTGQYGYTGERGSRAIPRRQPDDTVVEISSVEYNPVSGNQDEEYIRLTNNNDYAVDITGWELDNAVRLTFQSGTVIPSGGSLYVTPHKPTFLARQTGPVRWPRTVRSRRLRWPSVELW